MNRMTRLGTYTFQAFYADFNKEGGRSCSKDVKKELKETTKRRRQVLNI